MKTFDDAEDFESYCEYLLNDFVESLGSDTRYSMKPTQEEIEDFRNAGYEMSFSLTLKGMKIIDRYKDRLYSIGERLFPDEELDICCSTLIEL